MNPITLLVAVIVLMFIAKYIRQAKNDSVKNIEEKSDETAYSELTEDASFCEGNLDEEFFKNWEMIRLLVLENHSALQCERRIL